MLEVSFDVMQSAALAALVAMVGRGIVKRVKFFQTYCIPGVIVAGLIVSFILGILRSAGLLSVHFEVTVLKEWFMDIFFTGVGLTASWALIKKGGKVCIGITITTIGLILGQDILGVALAVLLGMHPLHGLGLGSLSLMGGVGTSSAIAPSYEALGAENAVLGEVPSRALDAEGPYYGVRVEPANHMTKGGVVANEKAQVLYERRHCRQGSVCFR